MQDKQITKRGGKLEATEEGQFPTHELLPRRWAGPVLQPAHVHVPRASSSLGAIDIVLFRAALS